MVANAATGAAQPPPSASRKARSAVVSARAQASSRSASRLQIAASSARHCTARAPWPGAGSMVSGGSHSETAPSSPSRRIPAAASTSGVVLARLHLANACVHVPPNRADLEVGSERRAAGPSGGGCSSRRRRLHRARRARPPTARRGSRARPPATVTAPTTTPAASSRRQVLEGVDGEVDLALQQSSLELGGEETLATDLGQRLARLLRPVARRREHARRQHERRDTRPREERRRPRSEPEPARTPACRVSPPPAAAERSRIVRSGDPEEVAHRACDLVRVARARTLPCAHGRVVQELLDERAREMVHPLCDLRIDVAQIARARVRPPARRMDSARRATR